MNHDEWLAEVGVALAAAGSGLTPQQRGHLLLRESSDPPKEAVTTCSDVGRAMARAICARASQRGAFGIIGKVSAGLTYADGSTGIALDLIGAIQSFRVELDDIEETDPTLLHVALSTADAYVTAALLAPAPKGTTADAWRAKQREFLATYAPGVDAEAFLADKAKFDAASKRPSGCRTLVVFVVVLAVVCVLLAYFI